MKNIKRNAKPMRLKCTAKCQKFLFYAYERKVRQKKVVGIEYAGIKFPKKTNVSKRINNTAHLDYRFPFRSLRLLNRWTSWGTASPTDSQNYFPFFLDEVLPTTYLRRAAPWTEPRYPASSSRVKRLYTNSAFPRSNATVRSAHVKISLRE